MAARAAWAREGVAYTFVTPEEGQELTKIEVRIGKLLTRAEIEGYEAFQKPEAKPTAEGGGTVDGDGDEPAEPKKQVPVFGRPVRRIRRAL